MPTAAMTVRLDANMKKQFDTLCQEFGMSSNTAINIFVNQVVRSRSIPFPVTLNTSSTPNIRQKAIQMFNRQRES